MKEGLKVNLNLQQLRRKSESKAAERLSLFMKWLLAVSCHSLSCSSVWVSLTADMLLNIIFQFMEFGTFVVNIHEKLKSHILYHVTFLFLFLFISPCHSMYQLLYHVKFGYVLYSTKGILLNEKRSIMMWSDVLFSFYLTF